MQPLRIVAVPRAVKGWASGAVSVLGRMQGDIGAARLMQFFEWPLGHAFIETFQRIRAAHLK